MWKATETFFPRWRFLRTHWPPSFWNGGCWEQSKHVWELVLWPNWAIWREKSLGGRRCRELSDHSRWAPEMLHADEKKFDKANHHCSIPSIYLEQNIQTETSVKDTWNPTWSCWGKKQQQQHLKGLHNCKKHDWKTWLKFLVLILSSMFEVTQEHFINSIRTLKHGGGSIPWGCFTRDKFSVERKAEGSKV